MRNLKPTTTPTFEAAQLSDRSSVGNSRDMEMASAPATELPRVLRWGPYPQASGVFGDGIGGYARYNSQSLRSWLSEYVVWLPLPMTVPRWRNVWMFRADLVLRLFKDAFRVASKLARERPDVLHITALYRRSIFREAWATWVASRLHIPVFYDIRAGIFEPFVLDAGPIERVLTQYVMRRATRVAIQGREAVAFVRSTFGREATWLPNCFLTGDLEEHSAAPLEPIGPGEPLRLVFLGYLMPAKGVDVLLDAAHRLSGSRPVRLTLLGHPAPDIVPVLEHYESLQSDDFRIDAPGRVELAEALERMSSQHIFVFPSRFFGEGHPNAVNEAMAMGLPVVASRQGFLPDVVTPDVGVLLDDAEDPVALAGILSHLTEDWPALQAMGRSARQRMATDFSDVVVLARTLEIYRDCARIRRNDPV